MNNFISPSLFFYGYITRNGIYKAIKDNAIYLEGKLLDVGCGSKPYENLFHVDKYIGLDYEGPGHTHENEQIDVFYDGITFPFPDNHFDSFFSCEVFEHISNIDVVLAEINRVCRLGGVGLIVCPFIYAEHETPADYQRFTSFGIKNLVEKNGFTVIHQEKIGTAIETLSQLFLSYLVTRGINWKPVNFIVNVATKILSWFLPRGSELYLDNLVVIQKVK